MSAQRIMLQGDTRSHGLWSRVSEDLRHQDLIDAHPDPQSDSHLGSADSVKPPVDVALRLIYSTIRNPWSVLFRRWPPSAVTVTMSSMRTPNLPAR
jgi:hypothetical protein